MEVRSIKSPGQLAYEADVEALPLYQNRTPRKTWDQLGKIEQETWHRNPTPRFIKKQK